MLFGNGFSFMDQPLVMRAQAGTFVWRNAILDRTAQHVKIAAYRRSFERRVVAPMSEMTSARRCHSFV
ncbi:hypothetical protein G3O06_05035 [Burkholderia sp. Ac-20345]|uniref:hypothetical protein n=1 Tax=Burkholderia sp. Ac-20345 TaxID=2703891 RepID=UPI00197C864C|nr:hypothetical protein [Burkholderia sp. Ac-20345]MBN3776936.1 hypothetical protein [Burkholderia sp. Ac-20345]